MSDSDNNTGKAVPRRVCLRVSQLRTPPRSMHSRRWARAVALLKGHNFVDVAADRFAAGPGIHLDGLIVEIDDPSIERFDDDRIGAVEEDFRHPPQVGLDAFHSADVDERHDDAIDAFRFRAIGKDSAANASSGDAGNFGLKRRFVGSTRLISSKRSPSSS